MFGNNRDEIADLKRQVHELRERLSRHQDNTSRDYGVLRQHIAQLQQETKHLRELIEVMK